MATDEPQGAGVYVAPIDEHPKKSNMAKEIVIQQQQRRDIIVSDTAAHIEVSQWQGLGGYDRCRVEKPIVPRLISALCELSGVSGVPTDEDVDKVFPMTFYDGTLTLDDKLFDVKRRAVKMFLSEYIAPLIARLQAEKQALSESNDNLNEANKQLAMDVHLLQAEKHRIKESEQTHIKLFLEKGVECSKLQAENAKLRATEGAFAEWTQRIGWNFLTYNEDGTGVWNHSSGEKDLATTAELLAEFRKETGK